MHLPIPIGLLILLVAGTVGGLIAARLRQPVILGYLLAGVAVGPYTPGPVADVDQIRFLAEVGVALLLFVIGTESNFREARKLSRVVVLGGILQVGLTVLLGALIGRLLDLDLGGALFLGAMAAITSTTVLAKVLSDRNETASLHGRIALGMSIVQDLMFIPMVLLLPTIAKAPGEFLPSLLLALAKTAGVFAATYILGTRLWPWLLDRVARLQSRELLLLTTVSLALGSALATNAIGISFATGAFLAGIVIAGSRHREPAVAGVLPLRDLFAMVFFVTVGMLFDPRFVLRNPLAVLSIVLAIVVGKTLVSAAIVKGFGFNRQTALLTGLALAQVGELSFVLARVSLEQGVIGQELLDLTVASALVTIIVNATLLDSTPPVLGWLARRTGFYALLKRPAAVTFSAGEVGTREEERENREDQPKEPPS
ncbi:MAG: cation:proton antiporter [Chloroflexota bacterium]|nr:cation:proton antiporter [Chloroflexota bacterium]